MSTDRETALARIRALVEEFDIRPDEIQALFSDQAAEQPTRRAREGNDSEADHSISVLIRQPQFCTPRQISANRGASRIPNRDRQRANTASGPSPGGTIVNSQGREPLGA